MAERKPKDEREAQNAEQGGPFEAFEELARKLLNVPREEADEERRKYEEERDTKRAG